MKENATDGQKVETDGQPALTEFKPGDVVELKSGSFPMTVVFQITHSDPQQEAVFELKWDLYGPSGRSNRLMRGSLPGACLKIFDRSDQGGNLPF